MPSKQLTGDFRGNVGKILKNNTGTVPRARKPRALKSRKLIAVAKFSTYDFAGNKFATSLIERFGRERRLFDSTGDGRWSKLLDEVTLGHQRMDYPFTTRSRP
jgi:hypothetical protein